MPRAHYVSHHLDGEGNVVAGAAVYIYEKYTTTPIAQTIFAYDDDHATLSASTLTNPLTTASDGRYEFWLDTPQTVTLKIVTPGGRLQDVTRTEDVTRIANDGADGAPGDPGPQGEIGVNWLGAWNSGTSYVTRDAVSHLGSSYVAIAGSTNNNPTTSPTKWDLVASKGDKGDKGDTGDTGPAGGVSDHGALTGLGDDDHAQYLNTTRHDAHDHSTALGTASVSDLSDVDTTGASSGQALVYDGAQWEPGTAGMSNPMTTKGDLITVSQVSESFGTPAQVQKAGGTGTSSNVSATWPTATTAGNLLVAVVAHYNGTGTINMPVGWVLAHRQDYASSTAISVAIYYKANAASESGSVSVNTSASLGGMSLVLLEYSGMATSSVVDVVAGNTLSSATTSMSSGTTAVSSEQGRLVVAAHANSSNIAYNNHTNSFVEQEERGQSNGTTVSVSQLIRAAGSATASTTASSASTTGVGAIVVFKTTHVPAGTPTNPARLATGSTGQVLVADSAEAAGMKWAGGMTLISSTTLASDTASITFSSIPQTFKHLVIKFQGRSTHAAANVPLYVRFNGDSSAIYDYAIEAVAGVVGAAQIYVGDIAASTANAGTAGSYSIDVPNYAGTTFIKHAMWLGGFSASTSGGGQNNYYGWGQWRSTAAITTILLLPSNGSFVTGTVISLYGIS